MSADDETSSSITAQDVANSFVPQESEGLSSARDAPMIPVRDVVHCEKSQVCEESSE